MRNRAYRQGLQRAPYERAVTNELHEQVLANKLAKHATPAFQRLLIKDLIGFPSTAAGNLLAATALVEQCRWIGC
jgi:hypothetical protein